MKFKILFNNQFVKINDKLFLPMVQIGRSDILECEFPKKYSRFWVNDNFVADFDYVTTKLRMISRINDVRNNLIYKCDQLSIDYNDEKFRYYDKNFGWFAQITFYNKPTYKMSFDEYKKWYLNGIENALTIEELLNDNVLLTMSISDRYTYEDLKQKGLEYRKPITFKNTNQFCQVFNEWKKYFNDIEICFTLIGIPEIRKIRKKIQTIFKDVDEFYALQSIDVKGYFVKFKKDGYKTSVYKHIIRKFENYETAFKFHKKMKCKEAFILRKIKEKATIEIKVFK